MSEITQALLRPGVCPACEYMLRGLPDPVRCPECGLLVGDDVIVRGWAGAKGPMTVLRPRDVLSSAAVFLVALVARGIGIVLIVAIVIWKMGRFVYQTKMAPTSWIWLSQRGYTVRLLKGPAEFTPWPADAKVVLEAVDGFAIIWLMTGPVDYHRKVIATAAISREEARELERRMRGWLRADVSSQ